MASVQGNCFEDLNEELPNLLETWSYFRGSFLGDTESLRTWKEALRLKANTFCLAVSTLTFALSAIGFDSDTSRILLGLVEAVPHRRVGSGLRVGQAKGREGKGREGGGGGRGMGVEGGGGGKASPCRRCEVAVGHAVTPAPLARGGRQRAGGVGPRRATPLHASNAAFSQCAGRILT